MRITRFQKLLTGLFLLAAIVVTVNAWLAFHAEEVLANSERWVTHTLQVITDLEAVLRASSEAESSVRGYLLTDRERDLRNFHTAVDRLPAQFNLLEHLVRDNPSEVRRLQQAAQMTEQRLQILSRALALHRAYNRPAEVALLASGLGQNLMFQIRETIQTAQQTERGLLALRLRVSAQARNEARLAVALASTLDILFVIFSLWSLTYERRLYQRAAEFSSRLEKLQSITDVAFAQFNADELTTQVLGRLRAAAATDALVLCRWFGTEVELTAAEGLTLPSRERHAISPTGPLAEAVNSGQPHELVGAELERLPVAVLREGLGSALLVPMSASGRTLAVLLAARKRGDRFSPADRELLTLAADRIALALDRAAAYDAERSAREAAEANAAQVQQLNDILEERVQQRTQELETTNRELEAFSYSVSHDLRAPLRTVDGFSVALAEDYGHLLEGDGKHYLARIRAGVQRMGQLIDSLLQLSRITRADLTLEPVDLSAQAREVAEEIQTGLRERPLDFSIEPHLHTEGDARLLRVIFENMFGNAAKFTGKVPNPSIAFGWSPERRAYYIRDNGAGFDQQYAGKLFVAFQRLHGDKDFQGSGIGLATVARVVRRHHGNIWAEGEVGHGATFWFTLP